MGKRIFALVLAAVMAVSVCGCGAPDSDDSGQVNTGQGDQQSEETESSNQGGADIAADRGSDLSDRHFYRSVAFYGALPVMLHSASITGDYGFGQYESAVVLDYDTETGQLLRKRVCVYYADDGEREQGALEAVGSDIRKLPYTEESFPYEKYNNKMNVLIWELPEDYRIYDFEQGIQTCFLDENHTPQDIDGLIEMYLYQNFDYSKEVVTGTRPYPYFGENFYMGTMGYTVCWYDTEWDIKMYSPWQDVYEEIRSAGYLSYEDTEWSPEEYGSTSYNTGGGYTGTYRLETYLIPY